MQFKLQSLLRQSVHYMTGRVGVMILGAISFPIFIRIFSVAEYGLLGLTLKIVSIAVVFAKLGVQHSALRFYEETAGTGDEAARQRYYSTLYWSVTAAAAAMTALFYGTVWGARQQRWLSEELATPLLWASGLILFRALQSLQMVFLRMEERTKAYNIIEVLLKLATVCAVCGFVFWVERSLRAFMAALLAVEGVLWLYLSASLLRRRLLRVEAVDRDFLKTALLFGVPLIGYEIVFVILDAGDRLVVQYFLGAESLGIYSAAYNLATYLEEGLITPLKLALAPISMKIWTHQGQEATGKLMGRFMHYFLFAAVAVTAATTIVSRDLVIVVASRKMEAASALMPAVVCGLMIYALNLFFATGLMIHKKSGALLRLILIACVLNITLNLALVPTIGLQGAALATVVSYLLYIILMARASQPLLALPVEWSKLARWVAAAIATALPVSQIELGTALANLAVKGTVFVAGYAMLLWMFDGESRKMMQGARNLFRSPV